MTKKICLLLLGLVSFFFQPLESKLSPDDYKEEVVETRKRCGSPLRLCACFAFIMTMAVVYVDDGTHYHVSNHHQVSMFDQHQAPFDQAEYDNQGDVDFFQNG